MITQRSYSETIMNVMVCQKRSSEEVMNVFVTKKNYNQHNMDLLSTLNYFTSNLMKVTYSSLDFYAPPPHTYMNVLCTFIFYE